MKKNIFRKFPCFASEKPVISKVYYQWTDFWLGKKENFSMSQIHFGTWYKKPFVDISYNLWVIMLTRVGCIKKSYLGNQLLTLWKAWPKAIFYGGHSFQMITEKLKMVLKTKFCKWQLTKFPAYKTLSNLTFSPDIDRKVIFRWVELALFFPRILPEC